MGRRLAARGLRPGPAGRRSAAAALVLQGSLIGGLVTMASATPPVTISVRAASSGQACSLQYATQDVFAGVFAAVPAIKGEPTPAQRLAQLDPPLWRVNSNTDGGPTALSLPFPTAYDSADGHHIPAWDFAHQASLLAEAPASVPKLLTVSSPPDDLFTGSGPLGPSTRPGTLQDQTYGALASYMANLVRYYDTGILASGSGSSVSYTADSITDASKDFSRYGNGGYSVTVGAEGQGGQPAWQTAAVTGVSSPHTAHVAGWPKGTPAPGSAYNLGSSTPPITSPAAATPWPRPPGAGPVRYWELMNEPDLGNSFYPRASPAILPPHPQLTGVTAQGGTLSPGHSYAYRVTGLNIAGVESAAGAEARVTLGPGQNAVRLSWSATGNLGLAPFAYRIYGREAGSEQAMVVVGRDAPNGLSWTDVGSVGPGGAAPPGADRGTAGFQLFRADEYRRMWDVVVPAMKAVDPSIQVVGPTVSNPTSLARPDVNTRTVTSGPDDQGYLDQRDFVQVLMGGTRNPPDVVSVHAYGGSAGSADDDAKLFAQPDAISLKEYEETVRPYVGKTPVWVTETNANAGAFDKSDFRGVTQFDSAWLAHNFARTCQRAPQVRDLFQFEFAINNTFALLAAGPAPGGCPAQPACQIEAGRPVLPYWTVKALDDLVPRGARLLATDPAPEGIDVLAVAVPPRFDRIQVLVVNHRTGGQRGIGSPATVDLQLRDGGGSATRELVIDGGTDLRAGPTPRPLGGGSRAHLDLAGYGTAFVEFDTVSGSPRVGVSSAGGGGGPGLPVLPVVLGGAAAAVVLAGGGLLLVRRRRRG